MEQYAEFLKLKNTLESLGTKCRKDALSDAQQWKADLKHTITDVFEGYNKTVSFLDRVDGLFNAPPCAAIGNSFITTSEDENEELFQNDVNMAVALIDDCIVELENLQQKFGCR